jgi:hypothetical protein
MTLQADRSIGFRVEWDRVGCSQCGKDCGKAEEAREPVISQGNLPEDGEPVRIQPEVQGSLHIGVMHEADLSDGGVDFFNTSCNSLKIKAL